MPKKNTDDKKKGQDNQGKVIHVCNSTGCRSLGSPEIIEKLSSACKSANDCKVKKTGCFGLCEAGPIVKVEPDGTLYTKVKSSDAKDIASSAKRGSSVRRLLYNIDDKTQAKTMEEIDFYKYQDKYVMRRIGRIDPSSIEDFEAEGGFKGLKKAVRMQPEKIIEIITESGLRGRGGAGFPTGKKWSFIAQEKGPEKFLVANADEGDPGSFMDRILLEGDPFAMIEGMIIAARAVKASRGIVYIRAEYPDAIDMLENALSACRDKGYLGKSICGKEGFDFDITLSKGSGAFVCGEETSLMNSVEGKRGTPRIKPPFPAHEGIYGKPTNINNVKTYAYASHIVRDGSEDFRKRGTEKSPGTAVLCLTGKVKNTGIVEVPMGTTLKRLVYDIGGGIKDGKKLKAVMTGGPSGGVIPASMLDQGVDYESLTSAGTIMGSGGVLIFDEDDSMPSIAKYFVGFTRSESCGKCVPCREGTNRLYKLLEYLESGEATEEDLELIERLSHYIKDTAACGLGMTAPNPVLTTLKHFRKEYEELLEAKMDKKPAETEKKKETKAEEDDGPSYSISDLCTGCGKCAEACPEGCITGKKGSRFHIDKTRCIRCGACKQVCPSGAIVYR